MKGINRGYQCFEAREAQLERWEKNKEKWFLDHDSRSVKSLNNKPFLNVDINKTYDRKGQRKSFVNRRVEALSASEAQGEIDALANQDADHNIKSILLKDQESDYRSSPQFLFDNLRNLQETLLPELGEYEWHQGVCYGLSSACTQAILSKDITTFAERLQVLNRNPERGWLYFGVRYYDLNEAIEYAQGLYALFQENNKEAAFFDDFAKKNPDAFQLMELKAWCELVLFSQSPGRINSDLSFDEQDMVKTSRYMKSRALDDGFSNTAALVGTPESITSVDKAGFLALMKKLPSGQYPLMISGKVDGSREFHRTLLSVREDELTFFDQNLPLFFMQASRQDVELFSEEVFRQLLRSAWEDDSLPVCSIGLFGVCLEKKQADAINQQLQHIIDNLPAAECNNIKEHSDAMQGSEFAMANEANYGVEAFKRLLKKELWSTAEVVQGFADYVQNGTTLPFRDAILELAVERGDEEVLGRFLAAAGKEDTQIIGKLLLIAIKEKQFEVVDQMCEYSVIKPTFTTPIRNKFVGILTLK